MSDYTVKREKEGILRIQAEGTKMPGPLTINERDYADDKQLIVGGGSSNPVGLAKVKFVINHTDTVLINSCFNISTGLPVYAQSVEGYSDTSNVCPPGISIGDWNDAMDDGHTFLITPHALHKKGGIDYTLEGNAEFGGDKYGNYIYITGDCTITINVQDET